MVFRQADKVEIFEVSPMDDLNKIHCISLIKSGSEPTFSVTCCYDESWGYEFYLENNSDYERVKYNIMESIFECVTMDELLETLSEIFEDGFGDIIVEECDCENCNHCCEE